MSGGIAPTATGNYPAMYTNLGSQVQGSTLGMVVLGGIAIVSLNILWNDSSSLVLISCDAGFDITWKGKGELDLHTNGGRTLGGVNRFGNYLELGTQ